MKHLLLDERIIQSAENVQLSLGRIEKSLNNPLFVEDRPWEVRFDNFYPNVLFDAEDQLFKLWYNPFIIDEAEADTPPERRSDVRYYVTDAREIGVCYAVSKDGILWDKPELGLVEFEGSTANNLVKRPTHGAGICKDLHDDDSARRYKMFTMMIDGDNQAAIAFSRDGIRWSDYIPCPQMQARGDTHNCFLWNATLGKYVGFTRIWDCPQRLVARTESEDFLTWTKAVEIMRALPDQPHRQTYALLPFHYAGVYLGLVMIFDTEADTVDCELAFSRDTVQWSRVCPGQSLIRRGSVGSFDSHCIYGTAPIFHNNELLLYYGGSDGPHTGWRKGGFGLARLEADRFACYEPIEPARPGTVVTEPIVCDGAQLRITADVSAGHLRAAVLDTEGFELDACDPITTDVTDGEINWRTADLNTLRGKRIRLRFELQSARLYAFDFCQPQGSQ